MNDESNDFKPSHLRLAASNNATEVLREHRRRELEWRLREMAANLLRVIRGAGRPEGVAKDCASVVSAFQAYRDAVGVWPSSYEVSQAVAIANPYYPGITDSAFEWQDGIDTMMRGALQIAASKMIGQNTQERAGERELFDGFTVIEKRREENRRQRDAREVRVRTPKTTRVKKRKPIPL